MNFFPFPVCGGGAFFHSCNKHPNAPSLWAFGGSGYKIESELNMAPSISNLSSVEGRQTNHFSKMGQGLLEKDFMGGERKNTRSRFGHVGKGLESPAQPKTCEVHTT